MEAITSFVEDHARKDFMLSLLETTREPSKGILRPKLITLEMGKRIAESLDMKSELLGA